MLKNSSLPKYPISPSRNITPDQMMDYLSFKKSAESRQKSVDIDHENTVSIDGFTELEN